MCKLKKTEWGFVIKYSLFTAYTRLYCTWKHIFLICPLTVQSINDFKSQPGPYFWCLDLCGKQWYWRLYNNQIIVWPGGKSISNDWRQTFKTVKYWTQSPLWCATPPPPPFPHRSFELNPILMNVTSLWDIPVHLNEILVFVCWKWQNLSKYNTAWSTWRKKLAIQTKVNETCG